jgi:hypothetical protein
MQLLEFSKEGQLAAEGKSGRCFWYRKILFFFIMCGERGGSRQHGTFASIDIGDRIYRLSFTRFGDPYFV